MQSGSARFKKANAVPIGGLVGTVVTDIGGVHAVLLDILEKKWSDIVGAANARNAKPVSVSDAILTIVVSSPVWMTQARFMKSSFIDKINRVLGESGQEIRDIAFTLDMKRK